MALMPKPDETEVNVTFSRQCKLMAGQLFDTLKKHQLVKRSISIKVWSNELYLLHKEVNDDHRIKTVLNWYCQNIGKHDRIPKAYSARSFRQKFDMIEQAWKIDTERSTTTTDKLRALPALSDIPSDAQKIAKDLLTLRWPSGAELYIPHVVDVSLTELIKLRQILTPIVPKYDAALGRHITNPQLKLSISAQFTVKYIYEHISPHLFIVRWYHRIFEQFSGWDQWSGKLEPISIQSHRFHKSMMSVAGAVSSVKMWFEIWDYIKERA